MKNLTPEKEQTLIGVVMKWIVLYVFVQFLLIRQTVTLLTTETTKGNKEMPKTRIWRRGFKSLAIRVKHKIGGRKSKIGAGLMSNSELEKMLSSVRKRDRNKLRRQLIKRGLILPS